MVGTYDSVHKYEFQLELWFTAIPLEKLRTATTATYIKMYESVEFGGNGGRRRNSRHVEGGKERQRKEFF